MSSLRRYIHIPCVLAGVGTGLVVAVAMGCGAHSPAPVPAQSDAQPVSAAKEVTDAANYGSVQTADESNFESLVLQAKGPVLVDFYADWCPPCRIQAPILDDFARETPHVLVVKVDVDQSPNLAANYGISSIPNLKVFRNGQVVNEHVGVAQKDQLRVLSGS